VVLRDSEGKVLRFVGTTTDIDDQKRAQDKLGASESNLRNVIDNNPGMVSTLLPTGALDLANQPFLAYSNKTLPGIGGWSSNDTIHPNDFSIVIPSFTRSLETGEPINLEHRVRRADEAYNWLLSSGRPVRDAEGRIERWYVLTTDIEDRKRAEEALRKAQGDLERINRVTTMGELTATLAHEISQPDSGVITNADVCLRYLGRDKPDLGEVRTAVTRILRDAQRAAETIKKIRIQFKKGSENREVIDVNEINRETVALLRDEAMRHNISRTGMAADLPQIIGDRVQLQQVAMNLIVKGIEAMKDVDGIREMVILSQRAENEQILVSVTDTGIGFPPQLAEQIFDPFFTTKPHGTGMGLRISRSIVESHGGRLWAVSSPGRGATFQLNLPVAMSSHR
jgi:PAS domain S-box-containing protein